MSFYGQEQVRISQSSLLRGFTLQDLSDEGDKIALESGLIWDKGEQVQGESDRIKAVLWRGCMAGGCCSSTRVMDGMLPGSSTRACRADDAVAITATNGALNYLLISQVSFSEAGRAAIASK